MDRKPILLDHQRVWRTYTGGRRLNGLLHQCREEHYPEEWILSVTEARNAGREQTGEGLSMVAEEPGLSLKELVESDPKYYLGSTSGRMGVLVKLIDSAERLTVQVHPDHEKARELFHSPYGKTECWYILEDKKEGEEPPSVYLGFREGITRTQWKRMFEEQDIGGMLGMMHRFQVKKGDMILVEGGVPHAIGANCFLAEIQEPTDYTIRIERRTPAGFSVADELCHQGLGFERMFDCFSYEGISEEEARRRWFVAPKPQDRCRRQLLGEPETSLFSLYEVEVEEGEHCETECGQGFCGFYLLEGAGQVRYEGGALSVRAPEQIFVPAAFSQVTFMPEKGSGMRLLQFFGPRMERRDAD